MASNDWRFCFEEFHPNDRVIFRVELLRKFGDDDQTPLVRWINVEQLAKLKKSCEHPQACFEIKGCMEYRRA